jgi:hypothetical protein
VLVGKGDPEHGAGQDLGDRADEFDWFFFCHARLVGPFGRRTPGRWETPRGAANRAGQSAERVRIPGAGIKSDLTAGAVNFVVRPGGDAA